MVEVKEECTSTGRVDPSNTSTACSAGVSDSDVDTLGKIPVWKVGMDEVKLCVPKGTIVRWTWESLSHNVIKVDTKAKYDNCTLANGETSAARVQTHNYTADTIGTPYFVCGVGQHCANGNMKAMVEVKEECT